MTRYDVLKRFADDGRAHRDHMVTFIVLMELWVAQRRPESVELEFAHLLRILKTKRSTLFDWLRQLETFGYIELRRSSNRYEKSTVRLVMDSSTRTLSTEAGRPVPVSDATFPNQTVHRELDRAEVGQYEPESNGNSSNRTGETRPEYQQRGFIPNSDSETSGLAHTHNQSINGSTFSKEVGSYGRDFEKGGSEKKRSRQKRTVAARPTCAFADSPLHDLTAFRSAFADDPTGKAADLDHYHARLLNWRDKSGRPPQRADWLATARTFMLNDYREGKLMTVATANPVSYVTPRTHSRSAAIEPDSSTGRRFGSW